MTDQELLSLDRVDASNVAGAEILLDGHRRFMAGVIPDGPAPGELIYVELERESLLDEVGSPRSIAVTNHLDGRTITSLRMTRSSAKALVEVISAALEMK